MENITIHIGLHKTGTTFLQRQYFPYFEDVYYLNKTLSFQSFAYEKSKNFFISNEALSGRPWNGEWLRGKKNSFVWLDSFKMAIENLKHLFPDAHIVVVFRKHGDLLISLYKQYIQEGGVLSLEEFYCKDGVIKDSDLNFQERLDFLYKKFNHVSVLSFEDFKEEGAGYFDDFFTSLGYKTRFPDKMNKENSSISGEKIELLRNINKHYYKAPKAFKDILGLTHLTPRKILQYRLDFWKPKDPDDFKRIKTEINELHQKDWKDIEGYLWFKNEAGSTKKA